jgi:Tfp pilus assembly protein FimT
MPSRKKSGFTLIELLVVGGITAILAGTGAVSYLNQQRYQALENTAQEVIAYLGNARSRAISQEENSNWGVHFISAAEGDDSYSLFNGASFSSARDQRYLASFLRFTNPPAAESSDINFAKVTGKTIDGLTKSATLRITGTNIYAVITVNGEGLISYKIYDGTVGVPAEPGLSCDGGDQIVILTWNEPENNGDPIVSYRIYRGSSSGGETLLVSIAAPGTSPITYNDTGLTNGSTLFYQVTAMNAIGESDRSVERSCTPSTFPAAPLSLAAASQDRQCDLTWLAPFDNGSPITSYEIYRSTSPSPTSLFQTVSASPLSYPDSTAVNGTTYYYRLKSVNAIGQSVDYSNEESCTPVLLPPTGLGATYGDQQCSLNWTASVSLADHIAGYNLYRDIVSPPTAKISELENIASYINTGLSNGTTYYYCLKTRNTASEESVCGNISSCQPKTVPGAPTNLTATGSNTEVALGWTAPSSNGGVPITAYKLYRDTSSPAVTLFKTLGVVTSYTDTEVVGGSTYYYRVKAVNSAGDSDYSNEATGSTFCTGKTDGTTCADTIYGSCTGCVYDTCDCSTSGTRTKTTYTCLSQSCHPETTSGWSCTCSRTCPGTSTDCGTTSCDCTVPGQECSCTGTYIRRKCNGTGSCSSSTLSCTVNAPDGNSCTGAYANHFDCCTAYPASMKSHYMVCVSGSCTGWAYSSCSFGCPSGYYCSGTPGVCTTCPTYCTACSGGTSCNSCSSSKPYYCSCSGTTVCGDRYTTCTSTTNCSTCGCPSGTYCSGGSCLTCPTSCTGCATASCGQCSTTPGYRCQCDSSPCGGYTNCHGITDASCT